MELRQLVEDLNTALYDAMCEGSCDDESFTASIYVPCAQIDVFYYLKNGCWEIEVTIYNNNDYWREYPNLEAYLESNIDVDWDAVEKEWEEFYMDDYQRNGFASEADFWYWKEGRR